MIANNTEINEALKNLWDAAKKATDKISTTNQKVNALQSQFDFLDDTISKKNNKIEELEVHITNLEKSISEKNDRIASQYSEISMLVKQQEKHSELETAYFNAVNENQNLKNEVESSIIKGQELEKITNEYNMLQEQYNLYKIENEGLKNKLTPLEKEIRNYEFAKKELTNNKLEIINRNDQIDKLKIQIIEAQSLILKQNEKIKSLEHNNALLVDSNNEFSFQQKTLEEKSIAAESEMNNVIAQNNIEKLNLVAMITALQEETKDIFLNKKHLEDLITNKENEISTARIEKEEAVNKIINERDGIIDEYTAIIKQYSAELTEMQNVVDELKNDFNSKNYIYQSLEIEKEVYETRIAESEENILGLKHIIKALEANNETLEKQIDEIHKQGDIKINNLENENQKLKDENNKLAEQNQILNEKQEEFLQINSLENDEDFMRTEKKSSELILENNRLVDIISELNIELDKIKTENRNTISQNIELNKSNKSYQHDIQKIQKLTTAFENLKKNNEEQSATIANLKTELTHYKKRVYDENSLFAIDNFNVNNEIESKYKQQIEALNLEVKNIKNSNKELLSENLLLKNEIKNINDNIQNEQNRNHLVPEQNKNQQQDSEKDEIINKLESFISKLEKKL